MKLVICNKKGGVGKSTTALYLSMLMKEDHLLVDSEGNLQSFFETYETEPTHVMTHTWLVLSAHYRKTKHKIVIVDCRPEMDIIKRETRKADVVIIPTDMDRDSAIRAVETAREIRKDTVYFLPTKVRRFYDRTIFKYITENVGDMLPPIRYSPSANKTSLTGRWDKKLKTDYRRVLCEVLSHK